MNFHTMVEESKPSKHAGSLDRGIPVGSASDLKDWDSADRGGSN